MKKTQIGWIAFAILLFSAVYIFYKDREPLVITVISLISIIITLLTYKLTIIVTDNYVKFSLGIGLIKGKFSFKDIKSCKSLKYIPMGWGVRWRPGVILYNVFGNKAIELEIKGKKRKIWIGTQSPDELAEYINSNLNKTP